MFMNLIPTDIASGTIHLELPSNYLNLAWSSALKFLFIALRFTPVTHAVVSYCCRLIVRFTMQSYQDGRKGWRRCIRKRRSLRAALSAH